MPSLSARMAALEKSIGVSGHRPAGMSDEQFVLYWSGMPGRQREAFVRAMSNEDLDASIASLENGIIAASLQEEHHVKS